MPSAILEPRYPHTGIGAALVVRASIYFEGGYKREKRAALAAILDAYASIARESVTSGGQALKWLWFNGTQARPFSKAPTLAALAKRTGANEGFDATYVGGDTAHEASFFEFTTFCLEQFQAELGTRIRGLDVLVFTLPIGFVRSNPGKYIELFQFAATAIDARHGHAGFAINLSPSGRTKNESSEYFMAQRLGPGVDIGNPVATKVRDLTDRIKTVDWLTLVDMDMLERVGGIDRLRSELPPDWYSLDSCAGGLLIRAGVAPEAGVIRPGAPPAAPPGLCRAQRGPARHRRRHGCKSPARYGKWRCSCRELQGKQQCLASSIRRFGGRASFRKICRTRYTEIANSRLI